MSGDGGKKACLPAPWQLAEMPAQTPVLLALSGGADSRFLLALLLEWRARDGFPLLAVHVNHGIRGEEAARDAAFCRELCRESGVELLVWECDVPALAAASGRCLEEEARESRYACFERLMREREIPLLVTAHNADDNAETVLFRLARGTGSAGLCGIAPVRPFANGSLVRPLLGMTKREILAACEREGLRYVTDSTNTDTSYARNRLRADVLPVLDGLFSGAALRIGEMSARAREDEEVLSSMAKTFLETHCRRGDCPTVPLMQEPVAIRRRILTAWLAREGGVTPTLCHIEALTALAAEGETHGMLSMPGGITVALEEQALCILREERAAEAVDYDLPFSEGETELPAGKWTVLVKNGVKKRKVNNLSTAPYIFLSEQSAIMKDNLHWRPRRAGDRILMGGMHRSVRKLYTAAKLPLGMRATLPLLCRGEEILWIPYVGVCDGLPATDEESGTLVALFDAEGIKDISDVKCITERE